MLRCPTSRSRPGHATELRRDGELARIEHTRWIERTLEGYEHVVRRTERFSNEAGAVDADAVVVRQVAAVAEHRPLAGVPHRDVRRIDVVLRRRGSEREVQARAIEVAVAQVARRRSCVWHGE